jgi:hypothetical protein
LSNQPGWKCDACRKSGLDRKRRCGWLGFEEVKAVPPVWARRQIATTICPKSLVSTNSETFLEDFFFRYSLGGLNPDDLTARQADAFLILQDAVKGEIRDGHEQRA